MNSVRAAVVTASGQPLEIREVQVPELEARAMLVKVDAATLCGTDVHFWHGQVRIKDGSGYIPGHETAGIVEEIRGERRDVLGEQLKVGDRVIWTYPYCGECFYCTIANRPSYCPVSVRFGRAPCDESPFLLGGCAEYQYVPPRSSVVKIPDNVSSPMAASASCAFRTVMHGYERLGAISSHETVVIQGSGPVGLYALAVARDRGACQVLVIGAPKNRLDVAKKWGADDVLNIEDVQDPAERRRWVLDHTNGRGADITFQCATTSAVPEGLSFTMPAGRYVSIGVGGEASMSPGLLGGKTFLSVRAAEGRHYYQALTFLSTRKAFDFNAMLTNTYPLSGVSDALQAMAEFREVKPIILPHGNGASSE